VPRWKISILGSTTIVSTNKRRLKLSQPLWNLIAYLLSAPGRTASRGRIAADLWPDLDEAAARHCLATTLWRAKAAFKPDEAPFHIDDEDIGLRLDSRLWVDSVAFDRRLRSVVERADPLIDAERRPRIRRAIDSYAGDFAAALDADWALIERERLKSLHLDALFLLAASYGRAADWPATVIIARRLCAAEPLREDAHRLLMIAFEKTGNRGLALRQYEQCRSVLAKELSVEPMPETTELYRSLAEDKPRVSIAPTDSSELRSAVLAAKRSVGHALHALESALERS
jgi:DNA-binding SARP family transcriptional activator